MTLAFVCMCDKCNHKDYRLYASQKMLDTLRNLSNQGIHLCYHCRKLGSIIIKELRYKESKRLRENFPNKKVLYTTLDVDELLQLEKDFTTDPEIK